MSNVYYAVDIYAILSLIRQSKRISAAIKWILAIYIKYWIMYICMQIETNFYYECSNLPLKYQY